MANFEQVIVNQLCEICDEMRQIRMLSKASEDRIIDVYFVTIPEEGGSREFAVGITKINFKTGIIINPDGSTEEISRKLDLVQDKNFMHSISIHSNNIITFRLDSSGQQSVSAGFLFQLPYVTYTTIEITCTEISAIQLFACTNPQATLGNFKVTTISAIEQESVTGDTSEDQAWDTVTSLKNNLNRIRHQIVTITGEAWGTVSTSITSLVDDIDALIARFDTTTGHDHDGTDSKKTSAVDVVNAPSGDIIATNVQDAINELDTEKETPAGAQSKVDTHAADTSTHGVAEIADVATVSAEIDDEIATHAALTASHGVAEIADVSETVKLVAMSLADIANTINGASTNSIPASYFNNLFEAAESASIFDNANLSAAESASIFDNANLSAAESASIFDNANLSAAKGESIVKNVNLTSSKRSAICVLKSRVFGFWVAGGNLATARRYLAGCGTQTAGLSFGGDTGAISAVTEEYDGAAWSAGGNLATARQQLAGCGTQTAGLGFGGYTSTFSAVTEEYDGAAWSAGGALATARNQLAGCGSQTAGLSFGGYMGANSAVTEEYDGAAWSVGGNLATARRYSAGCGTQTAGLSFGGGTPLKLASTEEYW